MTGEEPSRLDEDSAASFTRVMSRVEEFIDGVREGEFVEYLDYDSDLEYERMFDDATWERVLGDLFADVDLVFDSGRREEAARAYGPLLHLLDEAILEDLLSEPEEFPFDIDDTKARYLRGLYEALPPEERAEPLLDEFLELYAFGKAMLTLKDLEAAAGEPLSDLEEFLPLWRRAIERREDPYVEHHLHELSVDACLRAADPEEMFEEIRRGAWRHPAVWLGFSLDLRRAGRRDDALAAAEEGLSSVTEPWARAELGVLLASTAREAGDSELVLTGLREAFRASGRLDLLLLLLDELEDDPDLRAGILGEEADRQSSEEADSRLTALLALLAGKHERAARLASEASPLGWSFRRPATSLTVAALLGAASGGIPEGSCVEGLRRLYGGNLAGPSEEMLLHAAPIPEPRRSLSERLDESLAAHPLDEDGRLRVLALLRPVVEKRVRAVVRRKRSGAYPRVALLATALAEALALAGRTTEAKRVLSGLLVEFPRHWGFRREMERALQASPILR